VLRVCSSCRSKKPLEEFHPIKRSKDGISFTCWDCYRVKQKSLNQKYYKKNRESILQQKRDKWPEIKEVQTAQRKKNYAKRRPEILENSHWYNLQRAFNLTKEQFEEKLEQQGGVCAICGNVASPSKSVSERPNWHVDHDHLCCPDLKGRSNSTCGECVRGILCDNCNRGLGAFKDSSIVLESAINYLKSNARDSKAQDHRMFP